MATILTIPELVWIIASFLPLRADISTLSQCNRRLHDIAIPSLYRDVDFSVFKVASLVRTLGANESLPRYCRRLSVTLEGRPSDEEMEAYIYMFSPVDDVVNLRKRILSNIEFVIYQCSAHGRLTHFSWDFEAIGDLYPYWLLDALREWKGVAESKANLQSLQFVVQGGKNKRSLIPYENALESLSRHTFAAVSTLMLQITIKPKQFKALAQFISSFRNVKVLDMDIFCQGRIDLPRRPGSVDYILPDVAFQHLQSFWLKSNTYSLSVCLDRFVRKQPSLLELNFKHDFKGREQFFAFGPPFKLKALNITSSCFALRPPRVDMLSLLSTLRIPYLKDSSQYMAFLNGLPRLTCLELSSPMFRVTDPEVERDDQYCLLQFRKDIIEVGVVRDLRIGTDSGVSVREVCTSVQRLKILLSLWSSVGTIRAFRLAYTCEDYVGPTEGMPDVLDEYTLDAANIPPALEYVLWEVPWMKKLYSVEDGPYGTAIMVYTGWDRLPGRPWSPTLTWTNESVFDHIGIGGIRDSSV